MADPDQHSPSYLVLQHPHDRIQKDYIDWVNEENFKNLSLYGTNLYRASWVATHDAAIGDTFKLVISKYVVNSRGLHSIPIMEIIPTDPLTGEIAAVEESDDTQKPIQMAIEAKAALERRKVNVQVRSERQKMPAFKKAPCPKKEAINGQ